MRKYYYGTKPSEKNLVLGYVNIYGDFVVNPRDGGEILAEIHVERGLLNAGESFHDYCNRVAKTVFKIIANERESI